MNTNDRPEHDKPATIHEAYDELSQEAFAVWIRLTMATQHQLDSGRQKVAKILHYSEGRSNTVLRELRNKGYIRLMKGERIGTPTRIEFRRCPLISGRNRFVKLSSVLLSDSRTFIGQGLPPEALNPDLPLPQLMAFLKSQENLKYLCNSAILPEFQAKTHAEPKQIPHRCRNQTNQTPENHRDQKRTKSRTPLRVKFTSMDGPGPSVSHRSKPSENVQKNGGAFNISKMIKKRNERKEEKEERRKSRRRAQRGTPQNIDWAKLDARGEPRFTFSPSDAERLEMIEIADRSNRDHTKKRLLNKIASEAVRIYTRYRRNLLKENGRDPGQYQMPREEKKYAKRFGEYCIRKGVTPQDALAYWHHNIRNFAQRNLKIPSLVFLSSPANIDTVACAPIGKGKQGRPGDSAPRTHGFSDESSLDVRLRRGLMKAGLVESTVDVRFLLTVQRTAEAIADGAPLFVAAEMKPAVRWAVDKLYGGKPDDD